MMNVFDMVTRDWEEVYEEIGATLQDNEEYTTASKNFEKLLNELDERAKLDLSSYAASMERLAQDAGYSKGFQDAINLMCACIKK